MTGFNTQPPEGGWLQPIPQGFSTSGFNTQPPEGGWADSRSCFAFSIAVSTHSRPKAAGQKKRANKLPSWFQHTAARRRLAAAIIAAIAATASWFQHTAARRRLGPESNQQGLPTEVSTHSRPKAAGIRFPFSCLKSPVSTHSRPKAAGHFEGCGGSFQACFNTQPPEGGWGRRRACPKPCCCFNTQPPEGGWRHDLVTHWAVTAFQHTAARRRLAALIGSGIKPLASFNTQPPEGGWVRFKTEFRAGDIVSTHSRPKAAGF